MPLTALCHCYLSCEGEFACTVLYSVAKGRNFGRKTQKGPKNILRGRENQGPNFCQIYQERAAKGPNFYGA
jgi:hypothetical protein